jgi:pentose-5-phosphate-3-epimerase
MKLCANPQPFLKIARLRQMISERALHGDIEVDGGIYEATAPIVAQAGQPARRRLRYLQRQRERARSDEQIEKCYQYLSSNVRGFAWDLDV